MKRTERGPEVGGPCHALCLEHPGGLVRVLKGRRVSQLRRSSSSRTRAQTATQGGASPGTADPSRGVRTGIPDCPRKGNAYL